MKHDSARNVIHAKNLVKDFGDRKGIFNLDFSLVPGEVTGFVGPNGSGKSTTINVITGLIKPDDGTVSIFGKIHDSNSIYKIMSRVGVMYSELAFSESLTPRQVFVQSQEILGKDYSDNWIAISKKLELDINKKIKKLSLGNKKKVGVVHALMHDPDLIIMDEPTSGLDPLIRDRFLSLINEASERKACVLLSSHDLSEIQEISDNVMMIKDGKIIISDTTRVILSKSQRLIHLINPPQSLISKLENQPFVSHQQKTGSDFIFKTDQYENAMKLITSADFYNFFVTQPSLEETFKEYYE